MLKITHNAGFFSCCTVRLEKIIEYFNIHQHLPVIVDSSEQFRDYKFNNEDITCRFFNTTNISFDYEKDINVTKSIDEQQFSDYRLLNNL